MPSATLPSPDPTKDIITKFTNCRLLRGTAFVNEDLWISSQSGKIIQSQQAFYEHHVIPDRIVDLGGKILSPGFIDVQLNGAFGFDFSIIPEKGPTEYAKKFRQVNKGIIKTGVTSYLPTLTSQRKEVYHTALPHLGPSGRSRLPHDGAESLGAHCEGPFLNPSKNGIHKTTVMQQARTFSDLDDIYSASNLLPTSTSSGNPLPPSIKMITAAPELASMTSLIPSLTSRGVIFSMGHTESTYEQALSAIASGATMITHLFNAMRPLHHRNPGPFGTLGTSSSSPRPYFGIIADGIHLHPTSIKIAFNAHPQGFILVTDAMSLLGMPDGIYDWTNGERIVKRGCKLTLDKEGEEKIAGSAVTLVECVRNFCEWSGEGTAMGLRAVTETPARMLGLEGVKGCLEAGADADLVVIEEIEREGRRELVVEQVWKFGVKLFDKSEEVENGVMNLLSQA